ncbi:MAG: LOG family protein [Verrucomicrobiales bacterium]
MSTRRKTNDRDFTGGALPYFYQKRGTTGDPTLDTMVQALVKASGAAVNPQLIEELIITALKLGPDGISVGDLKLINRSVREMRDAAKMFAPFANKRKCVVFGSARTPSDQPEALIAEAFSRRIAEEGFMVITGAGDGIMGAGQRGAGRDNSFGLNIKLPFEQGANETIGGDPKLVTFNYFFTRKISFVKEADAYALFPGGFGTMDELFEALTLIQTGKAAIMPVVMVDKPGGSYWHMWSAFVRDQLFGRGMISAEDFSLFRFTDNANEAVDEILRFYRVFHSYRYVGQDLVIRMSQPLSETRLNHLNESFRDILASGDYRQGPPPPGEQSEPEIASMPRLIFRFNRRSFGRLRQLIDAINASNPD